MFRTHASHNQIDSGSLTIRRAGAADLGSLVLLASLDSAPVPSGPALLAERDGRPVGRISAQVDRLVLHHMGAGIGQWGMFEAADAEVAGELIHRAEAWLRGRDMTRSMGPFSLSIWDEPGLLIKGHDHPPMVMMGHNKAEYEAWVEAAGYAKVKDLLTYDLDVTQPFPPLVQRIVAAGEKRRCAALSPTLSTR